MQQRTKRNVFIALFLLPTFAFFCMFTLYPIAKGAQLSLYEWSGSSQHRTFIGLDNFRQLLTDPIIWTAIKNDYFLVAGKVVGIMLLATFFAVAVTRLNVRGSGFYRAIFFIPNIISVVVIGVLWRFVYNPNLGFINSFLSLFSDVPVRTAWLGDENTAMWSLLWPSIWAGIGFYMILLIAAILSIPAELYEAADLDGASQGRQFWSVTLPLIWDQMKISILHIVMTTLNGSFIIVWIMTEGGPDNSTQVMGSYLYQMGFRQYHMGYAAAIGVLILLLSLLTTVLLQQLLKRESTELA